MNPNEIKKALEDWIKNFDGTAVEMAILSGAFLYIDQLESNLQLLKNDFENLKGCYEDAINHNRQLRVKRMNDYAKLKTAKSNAVKEFAERLCVCRVSNDPVVIAVKAELKEIVGDEE